LIFNKKQKFMICFWNTLKSLIALGKRSLLLFRVDFLFSVEASSFYRRHRELTPPEAPKLDPVEHAAPTVFRCDCVHFAEFWTMPDDTSRLRS
jgi:hypothetical protein